MWLATQYRKRKLKKSPPIVNCNFHPFVSILIPCHRVLGSNGKLTGYAAGIDKKMELLKLENILDD